MLFTEPLFECIKALLFPAFCLCCRREGAFLCDVCFQHLGHSGGQKEFISAEGSAGTGSLDGILSAARYEDGSLLARLIHYLKYEYVEALADPLGTLLVEALTTGLGEIGAEDLLFAGSPLILCPVPLHIKRERWRGFNQAELLAKKVGTITGYKVCQLLERIHFKKPQMELSREERLRNTDGAFRIRTTSFRLYETVSALPAVILVDDVATTISTLNSCALELKKAGFKKVLALVIARVD